MMARGSRDWYSIARAEAAGDDGSDVAEVHIYEQIGESFWGGGVSARRLANELADLDVSLLRVFINSPGGAAWDGVTIMNALRRHKARVEVTVDGLAASAASVIAMAGDRVVMNRGSQMMVHDAWGWGVGNAADLAETSAVLSKLSDSLADVYAARAGHDRGHWRAIMQAETWYTAEEAVTAGLADEWVDAPASDSAFNLAGLGFNYAGRDAAPAPVFEAPAAMLPRPTGPGDPNRKEALMTEGTLAAGVRERLGVTDAAATDETLLAALDEALAEQPELPVAEVAVLEAAVPEGVAMIDEQQLADLRADAAAGRAARAQQETDRREGVIQSALRDGRISASSADHYRALLEADEERTTALLSSLTKNSVPVAELGHGDDSTSEDERLLAKAGWAPKQKGA